MRHAHALFCDDIREEKGDKISFMGIYGTEIRIEGTPPFALPKLAFVVWLTSTLEKPLKKLVVHVRRPEHKDLRFDVPINSIPQSSTDIDPSNRMTAMLAFGLPAYEIRASETARIEIETDDELITAGTYKFLVVPPQISVAQKQGA